MKVDSKKRWYRNPKNRNEWLHGNPEEVEETTGQTLARMQKELDELKYKLERIDKY
jgi:hypothetical protein